MIWGDFFYEGGLGIYPTALCGFLLVAAACLLALRPERRFVPLVVSLGLLTLGSGLFATWVGYLKCFHGVVNAAKSGAFAATGSAMPAMVLEGIAQASHCFVLALCLVVSALWLASIAAWRASRTRAAG